MTWVWDNAKVGGNELLVLLAMADFANDEGFAYPRVSTLAAKTRVSERTVQRVLKQLTDLDELDYEQGGGRGRPNGYVVLMGRPGYAVKMGDNLSPIPERVTPGAEKGDTPGTERVTLLSPEPSLEPSGTVSKNIMSTTPPAVDAVNDRPDIQRVCTALAEAIAANGAKRPTITGQWRTQARLAMDVDGRSEKQMLNMIAWATADPFWCSNILSMRSLRAKYDQMKLQAQRGQAAAAPQASTTDSRVSAAFALADKYADDQPKEIAQ